MMKAILTRIETGDAGTFGQLICDGGYTCVTGELPWRDLNSDGLGDPKTSCIQPGVYLCAWGLSPKYGSCYHVHNVTGRSHILIHAANWMGDAGKGFKSQLLGCIALGKEVGELEGQRAILASKAAVLGLQNAFALQSFDLVIRWKEGLP